MVHRWCLLVAPMLVALSAPAAGEPLLPPGEADGPYVELSAGYLALSDVDGDVGGVDVEVEYDDGFAIGGQLGYKYNVFRVALEFEYGHSGFDSLHAMGMNFDLGGDFDIFRGTASVYYDFDNASRFTPYFGGGLGAAYIDVDDVTVAGMSADGSSDTYFSAHGELGLAIGATDQVTIVPAYRFIWVDDGEGGFDDDTAHLFKMGLRFRF